MSDDRRTITESEPLYAGLRMSADEYEALPDDGHRYEVIDGVVVMAPSPSAEHQDVSGEIERQLRNYLVDHPVGWVLHEMDVRFDRKLLYQPDLLFVSRERLPRRTPRVHVIPEMVLEVLSPGTKARDLTTKKRDYERYGVSEYWIVDPARKSFACFRNRAGKLGAVKIAGRVFKSEAVPGFELDMAALRRVLRGD